MSHGLSASPTKATGTSSLTEEGLSELSLTPQGTSDGQQTGCCQHATPPDAYHTCIHPYHEVFSETNIPPLLFRLEPPRTESFVSPKVSHLVEGGEAVKDQDGGYIRDFWFLPRYISKSPPAWLLEFWMRTDSRLSLRDIKARMAAPKSELPSDRALMNLRERGARRPLGLSCWSATGSKSKAELERVARLSYDQISFNTTMRIEYSRNTDAIPIYLVDRSFDPSTARRFPLDKFLVGGQRHVPGARIKSVIEQLFNDGSESYSSDNVPKREVIQDRGSYQVRQQQQQQQQQQQRGYPVEQHHPIQETQTSNRLGTGESTSKPSHDIGNISLDNQIFEYMFPPAQPDQRKPQDSRKALKRKR